MTTAESAALKERLKAYCVGVLQSRLNTAEELISRSQEAANNESKSSAGDKYETGRAMGQLEKQMYQQQAAAIREELGIAIATDTARQAPAARAGSLIQLNDRFIFVCVGIGKVLLDGRTIILISSNAPIARELQTKTVGEAIVMGSVQLQIVAFM